MKILKVIVDEMPSCCAMCDYFNDEVGACNIMFREISVRTYQQSRPDWCPLVAENVYRINIIQEYVRNPFENRHESEDE